MNNILHAAFATAEEGIRAAEALLYHGVRVEAINLILPPSHPAPTQVVKSTPVPEFNALTAAEAKALTIPHLPLLPRPDVLQNYGAENVLASNEPGYKYDAFGAEILDPVPSVADLSLEDGAPTAILDTKEGTGVGLVLGLLTAMCIPGIGMIAGSGIIVAGLLAAFAGGGGIAGGIYGYLVARGVAHNVARLVSNHLEAGGTTLSVSVSDVREEAGIVNILQEFGGRIIQQS